MSRKKQRRKKTSDSSSKKQNYYTNSNSSTGVNYPQSVLSGVRKTFGFKCDTGLAEAFKPVAKRYFGSICRPLECFMIAVLALQKEQVNFGETITIENLNVERNLRPRRRLVVDVCGFRGCNEPAVAVGVWREKQKLPLCEGHLLEAEGKPGEWEIVSRG